MHLEWRAAIEGEVTRIAIPTAAANRCRRLKQDNYIDPDYIRYCRKNSRKAYE
jgi:hypothetical protein